MNFIPSKMSHQGNINNNLHALPRGAAQGDLDDSNGHVSEDEFEAYEHSLTTNNPQNKYPNPNTVQNQPNDNISGTGNTLNQPVYTYKQDYLQPPAHIMNYQFSSALSFGQDQLQQQQQQQFQQLPTQAQFQDKSQFSTYQVQQPSLVAARNNQNINNSNLQQFQSQQQSQYPSNVSYQALAENILGIRDENVGAVTAQPGTGIPFPGTTGIDQITKNNNNNNINPTKQQNLRNQEIILKAQEFQDSLKPTKHMNSKAQDQLFKRLNHEATIQQENKQLLALKQERKIMEECTFAPQIQDRIEPFSPNYMQDQQYQQRSLQQFLADQEKFVQNQSQKIAMLRNQAATAESEFASHQPRINPKSEAIASRHRDTKEGSVHERLFKQQQTKSFMQQNESTFQPSINTKSRMLTRKGNVEEHLYADAMRRLEDKKTSGSIISSRLTDRSQITGITSNTKRTSMNNNNNQSNLKSNSTTKNSKNEELIASRFVRDFEAVCDRVLPDPLSERLDYIQTGEILRQLNFLSGLENNERSLLSEMWRHLRGDQNTQENQLGVSKCSLCQFLLVVLGIYSFQLHSTKEDDDKEDLYRVVQEQSREDTEDEGEIERQQEQYQDGENQDHNGQEQYQQQQQFHNVLQDQPHQELLNQHEDDYYGDLQDAETLIPSCKGQIDENGEWSANIDESIYLHRQFELFYRNRLCFEQLKKVNEVESPSTFEPVILEASKKMADNYRERLLEQTAALIENQEINVRVPASGKITHVDLLMFQKQAQLNERQKKIEQSQSFLDRDCTFHPQTLAQQQSQQGYMKTTGVSKSNQLYELAKHKASKNVKVDKSKNEIEFEKNVEECTFKPDTNLSKGTYNKTNTQRQSNSSQILPQQQSFQLNISAVSTRDADKAVQRMRAANQMRQEKNIMLSRGYALPQNQQKKQLSQKTQPQSSKNQGNNSNNGSKNQVSSRLYNDQPIHRQKQKQTEEKDHIEHGQHEEQFERQDEEENHGHEDVYYDSDEQGNKITPESWIENRSNPQKMTHFMDQKQSKLQYTSVAQNHPSEKVPLLFVDVNLGKDKIERIAIYEGDNAEDLANQFAVQHYSVMKGKLKELLDSQIECLLTKIDEESFTHEHERLTE